MDVITENKLVPKLRFENFSDNWIRKSLNEIVDLRGRIGWKGLSTKDYIDSGPILLGVRNITKDHHLTFDNIKHIPQNKYDDSPEIMLKNGYLLLAKTGATIGKVCVVNNLKEQATVNAAINVIECKSDIIHNYFLYNQLSGIKCQNQIWSLASPGAQPNLFQRDIKTIKIYFPSLPEQEKIASFLSAIDEKLHQLTKKKGLLEEYKKGVMQKIFSQELRFKDDNRNKYPDWLEKKLGEVAKFRRGSFPQPYGLRKWYDDENGFPFVQVFDVADNMLLKSTTKRKISEEAKALSVFVKKGTIVLTIQGSIGRIAITQYDACVDRTLLIFQSFNYPIDIVYFTYIVYLLFDIEKRKAPGGIIKTITKEALSSFKIKLPTLSEQQTIANFLSSLDRKIVLVSTQIENTKAFKKGLLQQMFV
jgi:type I restriction enzyme, S subunit